MYEETVKKFWNDFEEDGQAYASLQLFGSREWTVGELQDLVPVLVAEGKERGHDMIEVIKGFQDAPRTDNGGSELPTDSGDEDHRTEDEDDAASSRDDDGQDRSGDEEDSSGS
jgi:hypothetical protein